MKGRTKRSDLKGGRRPKENKIRAERRPSPESISLVDDNMKRLYILKVGTTYPAVAKMLGDFDAWTMEALGGLNVGTCVLDVENGAPLPPSDECAGVVITGSHSFVTDELPWSVEMEKWIPSLLEACTPVFGICYGHQLLARDAGGTVDFHPRGEEIGTVQVHLLPECAHDVLFRSLPRSFLVHVTHSQSVLRLPPGATPLACNAHDPHQAFRIGKCAWGVQFHPEYSAGIMRSYIRVEASESETAGLNIPELLNAVQETPVATRTLRNFGRFVESRPADRANAGS
jgi:GMP synthase (glutamine-hydrolysing)